MVNQVPATAGDRWPRLALELAGGGERLRGGLTKEFSSDSAKHPEAVPHRVEVTGAMNSPGLEAGHLDDGEVGPGDAEVEQGLDLEAIAPEPAVAGWARSRHVQLEQRKAVPPERIVAVAQIAVSRREET